ncbi:MAG: hypothetical protein U0787_04900 [Polyangia bacterium]
MNGKAIMLSALLWLGFSQPEAHAHALDLTTAKVSLRDAHAEVIIELDLLSLFPKTATELAVLTDAELDAELANAKQHLSQQTDLRSDGKRLPIAVTGFPNRDDLRMLAATTSANGKQHGPLVRIRLESPAQIQEAKQLGIGLPAVLGPVVTTFVQPSTQFLSPGQSTTFPVLAVPRTDSLPLHYAIPWIATGLALTGLWVVRRRQTRSSSS